MIFVKQYAPPPVRMDEILRYAAAKEGGEDVRALAISCLNEAEEILSYSVCYGEFPILQTEGGLDLSFCSTDSATLQKTLAGCHFGILFAATLGLGIDRLISKYTHTSPARAWMLQAIGSERIEALCDAFCREISAEKRKTGATLTPRVSPGYGDISLCMQKKIFETLSCERRIGLFLNSSLIMTPTKSVTAIMGIKAGEAYEHS